MVSYLKIYDFVNKKVKPLDEDHGGGKGGGGWFLRGHTLDATIGPPTLAVHTHVTILRFQADRQRSPAKDDKVRPPKTRGRFFDPPQ